MGFQKRPKCRILIWCRCSTTKYQNCR